MIRYSELNKAELVMNDSRRLIYPPIHQQKARDTRSLAVATVDTCGPVMMLILNHPRGSTGNPFEPILTPGDISYFIYPRDGPCRECQRALRYCRLTNRFRILS